jgi:cytochrome b-561
MSDETKPQKTPESAGEGYSNSRVFAWLDERLDLQGGILGKAFPEDRYGSFLLGEVALFSFTILAMTGTYLGLLYAPVATKNWKYTGQVSQYAGQNLPGAFASVLRISYDIRLGMYFRMMHHWAAYFFIAAIALHMFRIFFSGVYRNPREPNWLIGSTLLLLALVEGFLGYALPLDNFSKTATEIGFEITATIPYFGERLTNLIFGGNFPTNAPYVLPRMFFYHVFLLPALIATLIGVHLAILLRQKHTEQEGARESEHVPPDDDSVIVGVPMVPNQAAMSLVVFLFTAAVISFMAALFPVQVIATIGPQDPFSTPPNVSPDWFFMWVYGALKLVPSSLGSLGRFAGGVVGPSLLIAAMYLWVFFDRSEEPIHFAENPLDRPLPTAVGVATIVLIIMLSLVGMNTYIAQTFHTSTGAISTPLLILTVGVPLADAVIVYVMLRRRLERKQTGGQPQPGD